MKNIVQKTSPLAGKQAPASILINVTKLIEAYYAQVPDLCFPEQRVIFGTSGHRGSSLQTSFNEWHILAITQAICLYRIKNKINGPLFLGMDTHALSGPAFTSALEVLAANGIEVMMAQQNEYTPTPVISHAILQYNHGRTTGLADGIIITPSHNPPQDGGFKYNPPNGGPSDINISHWIQTKANELLENKLSNVKKIPYERALHANTTHHYDYLHSYIDDLHNVIDMNLLAESKIHIGVDPLGGAGVHYWEPIAERYNLNLTVVNKEIDPTFRFMSVDWDGHIRMDPASPYAMAQLIQLKDRFDITFACDTDHDRHGIITQSNGLMAPNHYIVAAISYLFQHRPQWSSSMAVGKTLVSTQMIDSITAKLNRKIYEVPVGFKWFVEGLENGSLGFAGEESGGACFLRHDGTVWTTDKDGIIPGLLSAEMTARMGRDPAEIYRELERTFGTFTYQRIDVKASSEQKKLLAQLSPEHIQDTTLAGDRITKILSCAPGNNEPIGGVKIMTNNGWFAARPSGTEDIYKIYAESFQGEAHLNHIFTQAQTIVNKALLKA